MKNTRMARDFLVMNLGIVLMAVGIYFFKVPNGFVTGGVTGIGTVLAMLTPVTAGAWIWMLNIAFLVLGFAVLGKKTGGWTVYCSMAYSALTYLLEFIVPLSSPLTDQPLLELAYAMLLTGIGSALIFNANSSSGGTDILALILKKYSALDTGKALLCVDFVIASSSFFVYGVKTGLFSMVGLFAKAFLVDGIIESLNTCKYFVVITSRGEEIGQYIMKELHHGVTAHRVIGEYTHEERTMIHTVCRRIEAIKLRNKIKQIDEHAFIIITTSNEIIGRGFRSA